MNFLRSDFNIVDATRAVDEVSAELKKKISAVLAATDDPRESSRGLKHDVVGLMRRVFNRREDVRAFEVGIIREDFLVGSPGAQELKDIRDPHPHAADAGPPAAFARLDSDPLEKLGVHRAAIVTLNSRGDKRPDSARGAGGKINLAGLKLLSDEAANADRGQCQSTEQHH